MNSTVAPDVTRPFEAKRLIVRPCWTGEPDGERDVLAVGLLREGDAHGVGLEPGLADGLCPGHGLVELVGLEEVVGLGDGLAEAELEADSDADAEPLGSSEGSHPGRVGSISQWGS